MAKTAQGLVDYCKAQVGKPYWFGCFGQTASEALFKTKKKQYPSYYTASDFSKQYGQRVHDCAGLIKGYMMSISPTAAPTYNASFDKSADAMYSECTEKGAISSIPEIAGICVWKKGHIGVYLGNGKVVEARGHAYGVIYSKLSDIKWTNWGKLKWVDYGVVAPIETPVENNTEVTTVNITTKSLKKGTKGAEVKTLQLLLNGKSNAGITVDGDFGSKTDAAVRNYQKSKGLGVDGEVGSKTWDALINA
ncbi:peptidoglycan-binding domain-containing protein [Priestia megaterium]|uniref:peptidoglycan-binding domain-containing protein n=1 Tax=Priestia megaterium TaxID=1404 RepID=UPI002E1C1C2B|nr:peptidoglycan-binding domain-containing protein [Priestia megaterium]